MTKFQEITHSSAPIRRIKKVSFGVLSPREIREMSFCEIINASTYEEGYPKEGGLADLRMGTTERKWRCKTCFGDLSECPGHFGHIELARPVLHAGFLPTIINILRSVCYHCSSITCDTTTEEFARIRKIQLPKKRLRAVLEYCSGTKKCGGKSNKDKKKGSDDMEEVYGCGNLLPKYRREGIEIRCEFPEGMKEHVDKKFQLTSQKMHDIFKGISDDDCRILGFNPEFARPDWFIMTVLPVSPLAVRPSVEFNSAARSSDDLTFKYIDIVKINEAIKRQEEMGAHEHLLKRLIERLHYHCTTLYDNEIPGIPASCQKSGKPIKSLRQRLVGKGGRVRGHLMGKRVDFSARTVITGDPNLGIDEVGVPRSIAMNLTYPEIVTRFNLEKMLELVEMGPSEYPGANYIIRTDGEAVDLRYGNKHLEVGYKVERHLQDGDIIVFNRQPSLHKMSIMSHKVKVMPYSTFRLNLSCTSPYNADFDGDEMNLHVPQTFETRAECKNIMLVPRQIVSPQNHKPVVGIVQDTLLGSYLFSQRDCFLTKEEMMTLMMFVPNWNGNIPIPAVLKPEPLWTGKQFFSLILPDINLRKNNSKEQGKNQYLMADDSFVLIERGKLLCGFLSKATLGTASGGVIHLTWLEKGPEATKNFLAATQNVVNAWLLMRGFSVGIGDTIADDPTLKAVQKVITGAKQHVDKITSQARAGKLERRPGRTMIQSFEIEVNTALNNARVKAGSIVLKNLEFSNFINTMVKAGSKGSNLNLSQIIGCVGQQNVDGKRIAFHFEDRTLPHFTKEDLGPVSRGFVSNSYLQGLTPQEFFFHAMGGREGLVDTAVKTSQTGYIQRRLIKAMEDVMVHYDGTVRNSLGDVVQFLYGEDGMDGAWIEPQPIVSAQISKEQLMSRFYFENLKQLHEYLEPKIVKTLEADPDTEQIFFDEFKLIKEDREYFLKNFYEPNYPGMVTLPVNLKRLIWNAQKRFSTFQSTKSDLSPLTVIRQIKSLISELIVVSGEDFISKEAQKNSIFLFSILLRSTLASKRVLKEFKLTRKAFTWIVGEIQSQFRRSLAHPGEMVGALAAQSLSEPATQMTLNTFHFAGIASKNVTLGVPRLIELINVATNLKTPSITVHLERNIAQEVDQSSRILAEIEYCMLENLLLKSETYFDKDITNSVVEEDRSMINDFLLSNKDYAEEDYTPWTIRLVLSAEKLSFRGLTTQDIAAIISENFEDDLFCISSSGGQKQRIIIRIRRNEDDSLGPDFLKTIQQFLWKLQIGGIEGITKVSRSRSEIHEYDEIDEEIKKSNPYVLHTEGCNLLQILSIPQVDHTKTISNQILEVNLVLGIEAARAVIISELSALLSGFGLYVNFRHLAMLVDCMTYRGYLMSITRHGINRVETGPLMRCSFEETVEMLIEAATFSQIDDMKGVTQNIMLGQLAPLGTGCFDLLIDQEMLENAIEVADEFGMGYDDDDADDLSISTPVNSSPYNSHEGGYSPGSEDVKFSPQRGSEYGQEEPMQNLYSQSSPQDPSWDSPQSPKKYATSPSYSPTSPSYSPTSPSYSPTSPSYSPTSPSYSPTSPSYSPTSPSYSPTSPSYSPTSPSYSPTSPSYSPTSPSYSPTSPSYSPTSPSYSPTSPSYSPTSPSYSPTSPSYSPTSPSYSPTSPSYSPTSPSYSPTSPSYSPTSPSYSPTSPSYSPTSPSYSPTSPSYSPTSPSYSPTSPSYSPTSPSYSPTSPSYSPTSPQDAETPLSPDDDDSNEVSPTTPDYSPYSPEDNPNKEKEEKKEDK